MPYTPHVFQSGEILYASQLNGMEDQISNNAEGTEIVDGDDSYRMTWKVENGYLVLTLKTDDET